MFTCPGKKQHCIRQAIRQAKGDGGEGAKHGLGLEVHWKLGQPQGTWTDGWVGAVLRGRVWISEGREVCRKTDSAVKPTTF